MKKIITHNGLMHADEVAACALIKLFVDGDIDVSRVPHNAELPTDADYIVDIGKEFDGRTKFDHHQSRDGKASAGLIWSYIGLEDRYEKISKLVDLIDKHDVGEEKAGVFEIPAIVSTFNSRDIYSPEQDRRFMEAVDFLHTVFASYKREADELAEAEKICEQSNVFDTLEDVIELRQFTPQWSKFINGEKTPHIEVVVWWDPDQQKWKAQTAPKEHGSFEANGRMFLPDESMEFVHQAGFFAVAGNRETMIKFLKNSRR